MNIDSLDPNFTAAAVVRWWEFRRPIFNLVLLIIGTCSLTALEWLITPLTSQDQDVIEPTILILIVVAYGFLVNLCYTLGWVMELRERKASVPQTRERGKLMFQVMLAVSSILASGPFWYACAYWVMEKFPAH